MVAQIYDAARPMSVQKRWDVVKELKYFYGMYLTGNRRGLHNYGHSRHRHSRLLSSTHFSWGTEVDYMGATSATTN